jgi:hypothetical protein
MKMKKLALGISVLTLSIGLVGCKATDSVAKYGVETFGAMVEKNNVYSEDNSWAIEAPDKTKFNMSKDFSNNVDFVIKMDAQPFTNSGLDVSKLPKTYVYNDKDKTISIESNIGDTKFEDDKATSTDTLQDIVDNHRDVLGYHTKLKHYGLDLDNGNKFEWADDMATNDKDIVYVLNPEPFIKAGVDPNKIDGWAYAKVEDDYKLLKPFDIVK